MNYFHSFHSLSYTHFKLYTYKMTGICINNECASGVILYSLSHLHLHLKSPYRGGEVKGTQMTIYFRLEMRTKLIPSEPWTSRWYLYAHFNVYLTKMRMDRRQVTTVVYVTGVRLPAVISMAITIYQIQWLKKNANDYNSRPFREYRMPTIYSCGFPSTRALFVDSCIAFSLRSASSLRISIERLPFSYQRKTLKNFERYKNMS